MTRAAAPALWWLGPRGLTVPFTRPTAAQETTVQVAGWPGQEYSRCTYWASARSPGLWSEVETARPPLPHGLGGLLEGRVAQHLVLGQPRGKALGVPGGTVENRGWRC